MNIELINEMEAAGFTREQTMVLGKVIESDLATKQDIRELDAKIEITKAELKRDIEGVRADLKRDIEGVRADLKRDIKELESRLSMKMIITSGGFAFAMLSALVTLAKLGLMAPAPPMP